MKITIYTIKDCPFCKQEKDYLTSKGLKFEEKNVQESKEHLAEMLQVSNKFAGVPFTVIEMDNGKKEMLKGFTQAEFDKVLDAGADMSSTGAPADGDMPKKEPAEATPAAADAKPVVPTPADTTQTPPPAKPADSSVTPPTGADAKPVVPSAPATPSAPAPTMPSTPPVAPKPTQTPDTSSAPTQAPSAPAPSNGTAPTGTDASTPSDPQDALNGLIKDLQSDVKADTPAAPSMPSTPPATTPSAPATPANPGSATPPAADKLSMPDAPKTQ